ncbi:thioredoxin family protein [Chryseobacterium sp. Tr-659]|uniref:thioredoxin family protein n=1 Tax=Chryseobacterium sp. Tr-659 TaxID=2608340 RepID=UPI0014230E91|nr:thioredoxin family protein [Chryseobacterium sp. Tr-659]
MNYYKKNILIKKKEIMNVKRAGSILLILLSLFMFGQENKGIRFEEKSFQALLDMAKKENKLIFIDAYTVWCAPCKLMSKNIFPLTSVGDYYNSRFINAKFDMEKGDGINIAQKYNIKSFPTYLFLDGDGNVIHLAGGSYNEVEFIDLGKAAEDPNKNIQGLKNKFENGDRDSSLVKTLYNLLRFQSNNFADKVIVAYFDIIKDQEITKDDVKSLLVFIQDSDSPKYKIVKNKEKVIRGLIGDKEYKSFIDQIMIKDVFKKSYDPNTKKIDEQNFLRETEKFLGKIKAKSALLNMKANIALENKDYQSYEQIISEQFKIISKDADPEELFQAAWRFNYLFTNPESLKKAIVWCKESIKRSGETYANTKTLAALYKKTGDHKKALIEAQKSLSLSKKKGIENREAEDLIQSLTQ